jgi:hypothetical protein
MPIFNKINGLSDIPTFEIIQDQLFDSCNKEIPNLFSLMRSDLRQHLGTASNKYRPIQLEEMLDTINEASTQVDEGIQHIGYTEVKDGAKVVVQSKIGNIGVEGDEVDGYFYTIIDNTGMNSNKIIPSTLRIHCDNQMHLISRAFKGTEFKLPILRHSFSFDERVEIFKKTIASNIEKARRFKEIIETLREQKFTPRQMRALANTLLPIEDDESSRRTEKRESIIDKFGSHGIANEGKTKWDALNAVTQFETHQKFSAAKFVRTLTAKTFSTAALDYLSVNG